MEWERRNLLGERPSVREEQKLLTRRRLVEAAAVEFAERGYVATTVEHIAKVAGVSRATFYLHFAGKSELIAEIWGELRSGVVALHAELGASLSVTVELLEDWLQRTFDFYRRHRPLLLAVHEALALESDLSTIYGRRMAEIVSLLGPMISRARGVDVEHARLRASLLVMQHERFCHFWILRGVEFDASAARETLAQMWFEQVGA